MVSSTYGNAPEEGRYSWVKDGRVNLAGRGEEVADRRVARPTGQAER
jgi:hypothetical protein